MSVVNTLDCFSCFLRQKKRGPEPPRKVPFLISHRHTGEGKRGEVKLKNIVVVELFESLVTVFKVSLEHSVKFRCFVREEFGERFEADFSVKEFLRIARRFLAVKLERILSFLSEFRIESVKWPVACLDREFLFVLAVRHVDTVVDARSVSNYE